jgi:hypothetical protein
MWPNPLRLASPERGDEGKTQAAQKDINPPPEHKNPEPNGAEETSETPTPEKPTVDEIEKTPTLGEYVPIRFS